MTWLGRKCQTMKAASDRCINLKKSFLIDRTRAMHKLEPPTLIVFEIQSNLIGYRNLTKMGY